MNQSAVMMPGTASKNRYLLNDHQTRKAVRQFPVLPHVYKGATSVQQNMKNTSMGMNYAA